MRPSSLIQENEKSALGPLLLGVGLAVSLFVGGAIKTFLGPKQIRQFIEKNQQQRPLKFNLVFDEARLSLSNGWWPRLGLELDNVHIAAKDVCDTDLQVQIDSVYVPIYLWKLFNQQLRFKPIQFGTVELSKTAYDTEQCASQQELPKNEVANKEDAAFSGEVGTELKVEQSAAIATAAPFDDFMERFNRFILTRWKKELKNTGELLDGFSVEKLSIVGLLPKDVEVHFEDIQADIESSGGRADLEFQVRVHSEQMKMIPVDVFRFEVDVDPKVLDFTMRTGFKEGRWSLDGKLDLRKSSISISSRFDHFPLSEVLARLVQAKVIRDVGDYPRTVWASCQQSANGSLIEWKTLPLQYSQCTVRGDLGSLTVRDGQILPFADAPLGEGIAIEVDHFSLRRFLDGLGAKSTKGVVQKHGHLSGEMRVKSFSDLHFKGTIEDFGLIFRRRGRRFVQPFERATGELRYKENRVSVVLTDASLNSGEFQGQISVNFDSGFKNGMFESSVSALEFHPRVTSLLLDGGEFSQLEVYGKGQVEDGKIMDWAGNIGISKLSTEEMAMNSVKTETQWRDGVLSGQISIGQLDFGASQPLYDLFQPLYLGELERSEKVSWTGVESGFRVENKIIEWKNAQAKDETHKVSFSSEGRRLADGSLQGQISVDFPNFEMLAWSVTGTQAEPLLTPSKKVVQQLAADRPSFREPIAIKLEKSSGLVSKLKEFGQNLSIGRIRDQVVNSAKSLIPSDSEDSLEATSTEPEAAAN